jgi:hypothetical protein
MIYDDIAEQVRRADKHKTIIYYSNNEITCNYQTHGKAKSTRLSGLSRMNEAH